MDDEHELISRVRAGDEAAWRAFVEAYRPFMEKSIARYVRNDEDARDCLASLLEKLRRGALERFDFRSLLTTWLFIVIRNHCRDFHRGASGVRHLLTALGELGETERRYFILYYIQGLSIRETLESMRAEIGSSFDHLALSECDERVRSVVARKKLGTLLDRLLRPDPPFPRSARGRAADGGETIDIPDPHPDDPGAAIDAHRLDEAIGHLRDAILRLSPRDQLVLRLRYVHGRSAREIAELLGFEKEKQVYHRLDTLLSRLRTMLLARGMPGAVYRELARDIEELCLRRAAWGAGQENEGVDGDKKGPRRPE